MTVNQLVNRFELNIADPIVFNELDIVTLEAIKLFCAYKIFENVAIPYVILELQNVTLLDTVKVLFVNTGFNKLVLPKTLSELDNVELPVTVRLELTYKLFQIFV